MGAASRGYCKETRKKRKQKKKKRPNRTAKEMKGLVKLIAASRKRKKSFRRRKYAGARWKS